MSTEPAGLHILRHIVQNYKIISAITFTPEGALNLITGKNGQGKTSLIESIQVALMGKGDVSKPVKDGEAKCVITTELGTGEQVEVTVKRTFSAKGAMQLEVWTAASGVISSPQAFINEFIAPQCFDPLAFMRQKPKDQYETLMAAIGLDPVAIDNERKALEQQRLLIGREKKALEGSLDPALLKPPTLKPDEPLIDLEKIKEGGRSLIAMHEQARALDAKIASYDAPILELNSHIASNDRRIAEHQAAIEELNRDTTERRGQIALAENDRDALRERRDKMALPPLEELQEALEHAQAHNTQVAYAQSYYAKKAELRAKAAEYDDYTAQIKALDEQKLTAIKKSNLPLDGLEFSENELHLNGIPLSQCSASEQLRASVTISMALNPTLKVILIKDGSLLDNDSIAAIMAMAEPKGYDVYMEKVDETGKVGFVIEDGRIVSAPETKAPKAKKAEQPSLLEE